MSATETKTRVVPGSRPLPTEEACPRGGSPSWWSRRPTRPRMVARLGDAPRRPGSIPEKKARATARRFRRFARAAPRRPRRVRRRARRRRRRDATRPSRGRHPRPGTRTRVDRARIKALKALKASSSVDRRLRTSSSTRRLFLFLFLFLFFRRSGSGFFFFFFPKAKAQKTHVVSPPAFREIVADRGTRDPHAWHAFAEGSHRSSARTRNASWHAGQKTNDARRVCKKNFSVSVATTRRRVARAGIQRPVSSSKYPVRSGSVGRVDGPPSPNAKCAHSVT